jgi:hypothetical protein
MRGVIGMDPVSSAIGNTGISAILLTDQQRQVLAIRLFERWGVDVTSHAPWDDEGAPPGNPRRNGWKLISMYVGDRECLMFQDGALSMWKFRNGSDLLRVLEDCPAIEFYVCDEEASYLLFHNHHDLVVGWGEASQWVAGIEP